MTEHDWLSALDSDLMFAFLRGRTTHHKYRAAYCKIFRLHWNNLLDMHPYNPLHAECSSLFPPPPPPPRFQTGEMRLSTIHRLGRRCSRFVKQHASVPLPEAEQANLYQQALTITEPQLRDCVAALVAPDDDLEETVVRGVRLLVGRNNWPSDGYLMRELFGNPFQQVVIEPAWLTTTVCALAKGIRQDGAFDRMLILADALQDAGCDSTELLDHLRNGCQFDNDDYWRPGGSHLPGCWALELLLGSLRSLLPEPTPSGSGDVRG